MQKTITACKHTGFVEKIKCPTSQRDEFKRWVQALGGGDWAAVSPLGGVGASQGEMGWDLGLWLFLLGSLTLPMGTAVALQ